MRLARAIRCTQHKPHHEHARLQALLLPLGDASYTARRVHRNLHRCRRALLLLSIQVYTRRRPYLHTVPAATRLITSSLEHPRPFLSHSGG